MRSVIAKFSATVKGVKKTVTITVPDESGMMDDLGDIQIRDFISKGFIDHLPEASQYVANKIHKPVRLRTLDEVEVISDLNIGILPY